eukprot:c16264_g1_i2.p1 GENE.c16264_g1_i2~~c16264_g1_i2.p1  ORF type:complete len:225 (+),score=57.54 c16264_g1_i2:945-1619(+)
MMLVSETVVVMASTAVMSAIPLAMQSDGISLTRTSWATEANLVGSYLPSLITAKLAAKCGVPFVSFFGMVATLLSAVMLVGTSSFGGYLIADFLSGLGWDMIVVSIGAELNECFSISEKSKSQAFIEVFVSSFNTIAAMTVSVIVSILGINAVGVIYLCLLAPATLATFFWMTLDLTRHYQRRHHKMADQQEAHDSEQTGLAQQQSPATEPESLKASEQIPSVK